MTKEQAVENLVRLFPPLEWYIVCQEKHKDGSLHLHLALSFQEQFSSRDMKVFDKICGQHGNYQVMRNVRNAVAYVTKEGDFLCHGIDPNAILQKKSGKFDEIAKQIMEGKTFKEIAYENPGFVMHHKRKIEEYQMWCKRHREEEKKEWVKISTEDIQDLNTPEEMSIACWLNLNIREPREFRQAQLYIHGPPKMGKSTLCQKLDQFLKIYYVPRDEDFYDEYEDGVYDMIVFDEFTNTKKMQFMNQMLDGQTFYLRKKGGQILKKQNLPVMILSNFSLEQNYKKLEEKGMLEPLRSRLKIVEVKEQIGIFQ